MALWALIVGILALGVAIMVLPQMIWGKPVINLSFESRRERNLIKLFCEITNQPIENKFLKKIGVYRRPIDIIAESIRLKM